ALTDDGAARTLTKAGTGRLVMATGPNTTTFLGGITASAGTLVAGSDTPFPTNAGNAITLTGSVLDLNGFDVRLSRLSGNASGSVLLGSRTLTMANPGSGGLEFSGVISGSGGIVKVGSTSQVLSGTNTFNGGILIAEGALYFSTNGLSGSPISLAAGTNTITITGNGRIGANRTTGLTIITNSIVLSNVGPTAGLDPANGNTVMISGRVTGTGGFLRYSQGNGVPALTGDNTFTGGVEVDARTLGIGHRHSLGTGLFTVGNPTVPPSIAIALATFTDLKGPNAITNITTFNQSFAVFATNDFELSGPITISNLNQTTVTSLGDHSINFSGNIDGVGALNKQGTNDLTLSGANTYAGDTTVSFGNLFVKNTSGSATGTNNVTVLAGATLSGTGIVTGPVLVTGGGIGAGTNSDKITLQNGLDMTGGGTQLWTLASEKDLSTGTAGTDFSQAALTAGNLALGTSSTLALQFTGGTAPVFAHAFWRSNHTWQIIALSGGAANPGSSGFSAISGTNGINAGSFSTSVDGSGNVLLSFIPLPAPPSPVIDSHLAGVGTGDVTISWSAVNGVTYQVQYKDDLTAPTWTVLGTVTATGSTASIDDPTTPPPAHRFYRIIVP
ncbi:MAG TPA: autotransporter-associated beta strand repeat-containing protein, partial [Candidatus Dormibacteraeota bacterium]|nr:autotransporter-associated beta strand repeat-containing protein [Candidatus Dormibacteraeota bacterium]